MTEKAMIIEIFNRLKDKIDFEVDGDSIYFKSVYDYDGYNEIIFDSNEKAINFD